MLAALNRALVYALGVLVLGCSAKPLADSAAATKSALMGVDGPQVFNASVVLNQYAALTADVEVGDTAVQVANVGTLNSSLFGALTSGDLLLIIQMQGADIDTSDSAAYGTVTNLRSAGLHEFVEVASVNTGTDVITLSTGCGGLKNAYTVSGKTQIVRVPQFSALSLQSSGTITAPPWDGSTGGIVAMHVRDTFTLQGTVDVQGLGFRPGVADNTSGAVGADVVGFRAASGTGGGEKGEGIAGSASTYDSINGRYGRGAAANGGGGGNSHRAGGGGGANATNGNQWGGQGVMDAFAIGSVAWASDPGDGGTRTSGLANNSGGGRGGYSYSLTNQNATVLSGAPGSTSWGGNKRLERGGLGGHPLNPDALSRLFLGGGGGAGDGDSASSGSGGRGGGFIYIMADAVTGSGALVANGAAGADTTPPHLDSAGGGGAGGTVIVRANTISGFSISANGGNGGRQRLDPGQDLAAGPGGGGAGGYIAVSGGLPTRSAVGGANGETTSNGLTEFPANGATRGALGSPLAALAGVTRDAGTPVGVNDVPLCLAPADLSIAMTDGQTTLVPGTVATYTITVTNLGPNAVTRAHIVDLVPAQLTNVTWSCASAAPNACLPGSGNDSINPGAPTAFLSLPSGAAAIYTLSGTIRPDAVGTLVNSAWVLSPPVINDPVLTNNVASDTDTLSPSTDLALSAAATPSPVDEDATITWALDVANLGPSQASTVSVTFNLPPPSLVSYVSASGTGWFCSKTGTVVICNRSLLAINVSLPITIIGTVVLAGGTLNWSSSVTAGSSDPLLTNNSVTSTTPVAAANDPPVNTVPGLQTTPEDVARVFSVANGNAIAVDDVDIGSDPFEITLTAGNGTLTLASTTGLTLSEGTGTNDARMVFRGLKAAVNAALNGLTFIPTPNLYGPAGVTLVTSDLGSTGKGGVQTTTSPIVVTVSPLNDAPKAIDDAVTVNEDVPTAINVLLNDSYAPDPPEVLMVVGFPEGPRHGTIQGGGTTPLSYTSNLNYVGTDTFTYTVSDGFLTSVARVTVTVWPVNDPPTAVDDLNVGVTLNSKNTLISVMANDGISPDTGESLSMESVTQPSHGSTSTHPAGVRYTPVTGYVGTDSFTYTISDGSLTATATVTVIVGPDNQPPVNTVPGAQTIAEDASLTFAAPTNRLQVSDPDVGSAVMQVSVIATQGVFTLGGQISALIFTAGTGTNNASMTFTGLPTDLNAALANSVFTPAAHFNGQASLQLISNDLGSTGVGGAKIDSDTIAITVTPVNDPPTANDDVFTVNEDVAAASLALLLNDAVAPDIGETLRIIAAGAALHGTVTLAAGGDRLSYTPALNFYGLDTFTYTLGDGNGGTDLATVTVNVLNANDPPTTAPDLFSLAQDSTDNVFDVLTNDSFLPDPPETLSIVAVSPATHGAVRMSVDGSTLLYTPTSGYIGPDGCTYTVRDSSGGLNATSVTITVGADEDRDGISDADEGLLGTNPLKPDSDDDGLFDGLEVYVEKTDPLDDDADDDGLLDGNEDANHNGVKDLNETDAKNIDTDGDGLTDGLERGLARSQGRSTKLTLFRADADPSTQTNPLRADSDGGGDSDFIEDANHNGRVDSGETDPSDPLDDRHDVDGDGLTDARELAIGLDPNDADADDDGVIDGLDGLTDSDGDGLIDAIDVDSDNDGLLDGTEAGITADSKPKDTDATQGHFSPDLEPASKTNPKAADSDGDGLGDGAEDVDHNGRYDPGETDATKADTDSDGLTDKLEKTAPNPTDSEVADSDGDGLVDGVEDRNANGKVDAGETDPNVPDTDHGGAHDGVEVQRGSNPLDKGDDYEVRGGGGCNAVPASWALLGVLLLLLRTRFCSLLNQLLSVSVRSARTVVVALVLASSESVDAQTSYHTAIDVQRFKPGVGSHDFLNIESAQVAPHLTPFVGAFIGYVNSPLVLGVPGTNQTVVRLINDLTFIDLSLGVAVKDRFELAVALPLSIARGQFAEPLTGFAAGDLRVVPKFSFFEPDRALRVGLSMPLILPTGGASSFRGGGAVLIAPRALLELNVPAFRLVANAGFNVRTAEMRFMNLRVGHEFAWGIGGELPIFSWLTLQAALTGAVAFQTVTSADVPVDVMAGVKYRLGQVLAFELGGGAGLTHGWASPKYQVVFGVSYQPAPVRLPESWFAPHDAASFTRPERQDEKFVSRGAESETEALALIDPGETDADRDGVVDARDKCPSEKENVNGVTDDDGCPEPPEGIAIVKGKLQVNGRIEFVLKRATLTAPAEVMIKQLAAALRAHPEAKLHLDVVVTEFTTSAENAQLGAQRAWVLKDLLIREGVERRRIQTKARGVERVREASSVELTLF